MQKTCSKTVYKSNDFLVIDVVKVFGNRLNIIITLVFFALLVNLSAQNNTPVGVQLSPVTAYSPEFVWKDVMKQSRASLDERKHGFMTFDLSQDEYAWDSGPVIPDSLFVDSTGYPKYIPVDVDGVETGVHTVLLVDIPRNQGLQAWGPDLWNLSIDGTGIVRLKFHDNECEARQDFVTPIYDSLICINPSVETGDSLALIIEIRESDVNDPVRNIRLIMPAYDFWEPDFGVEEEEDFHIHFLHNLLGESFPELVDNVHVIKTTHWQRTVCSGIVEWEDRAEPDFYTQATRKGVAYEYIARLANETGDTLWLNVPHLASDSFVYKMAELFYHELADSIHFYLEYSHELWSATWDSTECGDTLLSQYHYAESMGEGESAYQRRVDWQVRRSHDIFRIFGEVFGDDSHRINKVLTVNLRDSAHLIDVANRFEEIRDDTIDFDILAIAPKLGTDHHESDCDNSRAGSHLFDAMEDDFPIVFDQIARADSLSEVLGRHLVVYEAWFGAETPDCPPDSRTILDWEHELNLSGYGFLFCDFITEWYQKYGSLMVYDGSITRFDSRISQEGHIHEQAEMLGLDESPLGRSRPPWLVLFQFRFCGLLSVGEIVLRHVPSSDELAWDITGLGLGTFDLQRARENNEFETISWVSQSEAQEYSFDLSSLDDRSGLYRIGWSAADESEAILYSNTVYIQKKSSGSGLTLFPNPSLDYIYIVVPSDKIDDYASLDIFDSFGRHVLSVSMTERILRGVEPLSTISLGPGIHFLKLTKIDGTEKVSRFTKL